jgi:site-specific DNA recombinase
MRAVIYARVSSAAQRERDTIAAQLRDLPAYAERQSWTLVRPPQTYVDDGRTAKAGHLEARVGLAALLRDAAAGIFDVVVVADIDRLTRSEDLAERGAILGALQRAGVRVASANSGQLLDLSTSIGDLFGTLQAFFAAEENRKRAARTTAGKLTAIQRGWKPSGPTPFGLAYDRATHTWSVHAKQAAIVVEILERVAGGESCAAIAEDLEARGEERPRGGAWHRERVWSIARSRTYLGTWIADRARGLTVAVPRLVDDELYARAQAALLAHHRRGLRRTKHVYLLEGLGVCASCGAPVGIRSRTSYVAGGERRYNQAAYVCTHRRRPRRGAAPCTAAIAPVADVDARVWAAVVRVLEDPRLAGRLAGVGRDHAQERRAWKDDAAAARQKLARLDKTEAAVLARFRRGAISDGAMDIELAAIARERDMLGAQVDAAARAGAAIGASEVRLADATALLERIRARIVAASETEKRDIVAAFVPKGSAIVSGFDVQLTLDLVLPARSEAPSRAGADGGVAFGLVRGSG